MCRVSTWVSAACAVEARTCVTMSPFPLGDWTLTRRKSCPALCTGKGQTCTVEAGVRRERMAALAERVELGHYRLQLIAEGTEHQ